MAKAAYSVVFLLDVPACVVSYYALAFRLGYLKRSRKSVRAPSTVEFLSGNFEWRGAGFILGSEYEAINDQTVSRLVLAVRTLWVGAMLLILGMGFFQP